MRLLVIFILCYFLCFQNLKAQYLNESEAVLYNVGISSVFAGIGAVINKNDDEKIGKVFLKGLWQGALGGALIYGSKSLVRDIYTEKEWRYSWYAKFVNSVGTSIVENASLNRDFWDRWHLNIGFNRLEFYIEDKFKIRYKIMPVSLGLTLSIAIGNKLEVKRSFQLGELIFSTNNLADTRGITYGNAILIGEDYINDYDLFAHEIIHVYQYYDYNALNSTFYNQLNHLSENSNIFYKLKNFVYFDLQGPLLRGLYLLEESSIECPFDNFFESEANLFSSRRVLCH